MESVLLAGDELTRESGRGRASSGSADARRDELGEPEAELRATYELRYAGQAFELAVEARARRRSPTSCAATFDAAHEEPLRLRATRTPSSSW